MEFYFGDGFKKEKKGNNRNQPSNKSFVQGKKVKDRKSPPGPGHVGMRLSRSILFLTNKRKGRKIKSLGQGNGKQPFNKSLAQGGNGKQASNKGGSTGSASEDLIVTPQMADVWRSWVFHHPCPSCIQPNQPQAKHDPPLEELLLGDEELDFEIYDPEEDSEVEDFKTPDFPSDDSEPEPDLNYI